MSIDLSKHIVKRRKSSYAYDLLVRPFWRLYIKSKVNLVDKLSDNVSPDIYVIQRDKSIGLCSYISTSLGHIWMALKAQKVPIVDLQTYVNSYLEEDEIGKVNAWEFYFKQPYKWNVNNISVCNQERHLEVECPVSNFEYHNWRYDLWDILYDRYVVLNDEMNASINTVYNNIFGSGKDRILGVKLRGTDYVLTKPQGHPIQPETMDVIAYIKQLEQKKMFDKIFVVADELKIVEMFERAFPNKVIRARQEYYDDRYVNGSNIVTTGFDRERDKYLQGKEYLTELTLLSKCNSFVGSMCGGTNYVYYVNHRRFHDIHIFNLGYYE